MFNILLPLFKTLLPFIIIIFILYSIFYLIKIVMKQKTQVIQTFPYEKNQYLFSAAERSFLGALEQVTNNRYRLMGKIRLSDIVRVKNGLNKSKYQSAFNKIQSKHVDFVACDPSTLNVIFVIELDDKSHKQLKVQDRDNFVDNVMLSAGIPIFHFTTKNAYSLQEIENILSQAGI